MSGFMTCLPKTGLRVSTTITHFAPSPTTEGSTPVFTHSGISSLRRTFGASFPSRTSISILCCVCIHAHTEQYRRSAIKVIMSAMPCSSSLPVIIATQRKMHAICCMINMVAMRQLSHLSTSQDNTTRQYGGWCICLNVLPGPQRVTRWRRVGGTHFVFMTCSSSCKRNLVEATELAKQHQVSRQRQQEGQDDSPHCNRGLNAVSPPGTPFPFAHLVAPFPCACVPQRGGSAAVPRLEFNGLFFPSTGRNVRFATCTPTCVSWLHLSHAPFHCKAYILHSRCTFPCLHTTLFF